MKRILFLAGLAVAVASAGVWLAGGAHRGWTRTSVPVKTLDEITGIEAITYEKRWVPGVDVLAGGLLAGGLLIVASCFRPRRAGANLSRSQDS